MKFTYDFRVDDHDTDINGVATISAVMRYMQETANLQHEVYGPTMKELRSSGKAFIISRAAMDLITPLYAQDKLSVTSWLSAAKGFGYFRNTEVCRGSQRVAAMTAFWGTIDIESRRPVRVEEVPLGFDSDDDSLTVSAPIRFRPSHDIEYKELGSYTVLYSDCDMNVHLNNTNYPRIFCDLLPSMVGKRVSQFSINYMYEARLGTSFKVLCAENEGAYIFRTELDENRQGAEARMLLTDI